MAERSSDGVYSRMSLYDSQSSPPDLHPDIQAILDEFGGSDLISRMALRVGVEMVEYGLDPKSEEGQQIAARVLRNRLTNRDRWYDSTPPALERRIAIEQSGGTSFVYYLDLYGACIKIGTSINVVKRLRALRRQPIHLLALEPGGYGLESRRHRQFNLERDDGTEDFARSPRLLDHIDQVVKLHGDPLSMLAAAGHAKSA